MRAPGRLRRGIYAALGLLGYVLSPASWWNDALINIPLALLGARILDELFGLGMDIGFAVAYWATNIIGIILMVIGASGAAGRGLSKKSLLLGLAASTLYTLLVVAGIRLLS